MNEQKLYKVLITGISKVKCMTIFKMLPWEALGYKAIIDANTLKRSTIRVLQPDILIIASEFVWYDAQFCLAEFLKSRKEKQIIVFPEAKDSLLFDNYKGIQVLHSDNLEQAELLRMLNIAVADINEAEKTVENEDTLSDEERMNRCLLRTPSFKIMIIRIELENQPNTEIQQKILARIENFCDQNNGGFAFREKSGKYCMGLFMDAVFIAEQYQRLSQSFADMKKILCSMSKGRVCSFSSPVTDTKNAMKEFEKMKALDHYRFFCAEWAMISEDALMRVHERNECNWVAIKECQTALMEATICGNKTLITEVLLKLFREYVPKRKGIHFFQMILAQLDAIWVCLHCITKQGEIQPQIKEMCHWCIEDAVEEQIRRFHSIALVSNAEKAINPLVIKALLMLIHNQDRSLYVGSMAAQLGVSEYYLSRIFKQTLGIGIIECYRYMIIYAAATDLLRGERKINELAKKYGFSDIKYFGKVFRQILGLTPTEWIKVNCSEQIAVEKGDATN